MKWKHTIFLLGVPVEKIEKKFGKEMIFNMAMATNFLYWFKKMNPQTEVC